MRILILICAAFLLMQAIQGCFGKTAPKTSVQKQQSNQNLTSTPSISIQTDSIAGDSIRQRPLNRKLVKRGPTEQLTSEPGKIVVSVCVDRTGKVISATFDRDKSSRSLARFAWNAEECAKQYVFEEDLTAPLEDCGHLTFVFERK